LKRFQPPPTARFLSDIGLRLSRVCIFTVSLTLYSLSVFYLFTSPSHICTYGPSKYYQVSFFASSSFASALYPCPLVYQGIAIPLYNLFLTRVLQTSFSNSSVSAHLVPHSFVSYHLGWTLLWDIMNKTFLKKESFYKESE